MPRPERVLAVLACLVLPLAVAMTEPRTAAAAVRPADDACPAGLPRAGLTDVAVGSTHTASIDCVAWWGLTRGVSPDRYAPDRTVTREQMASFLASLITRTGGDLPSAAPDAFADDDGSVHEAAIDRLAAVGVVTGRGGGLYEPGAPVRREQMATFLVRALELVAGQALPSDGDAFADDAGSVHAASIDKAAAAGVTGGVAPGRFNPVAPVRRDQMASFLTRTLDHVVEGTRALLRVDVEGLPVDAQPDLRLLGDDRRPLSPGVHAVRPGVVDVAARPVHTGDGEWAASVTGAPTEADAGDLVNASVVYLRPVVAEDTVVVPVQQLLAAEVEPSGAATLRVTDEAPALAVGDVVVAGVGPETPEGLLGRVESLTGDADGATLATTSPATLFDAVPEGAFDVVGSDAAVGGSGLQAPGVHATASGLGDLVQPLLQRVQCGASGEMTVSGSLTVTPDFHLSASWGGPLWDRRVRNATLSASITESAELRATARATAACRLPATGIPLQPVRLRPVTFTVGPVPVVVVPQVQLVVDAEGQLTSELTVAQTQSFTATAGLRYDRGEVTPFGNLVDDFDSEVPEESAEVGHLFVTAGPRLDLLLYGVAGPGVSVDATARLDVALDEDPWWVATARLRAGVAFTAPLLGLDERKDDVLSRTWTVAQAAPRAGAVCEGVPGCRQVADVDVDGDDRPDQVAVVITSAPPLIGDYTLRVLTRAGLLTREVAAEFWHDDSPLVGATRIDPHPGKDLVLGVQAGAHTQFYRVVVVRDGRLEELPPPPGWESDGTWFVDGSFAFDASLTCEAPGRVLLRDAVLDDAEREDYAVREERFTWSGNEWITSGLRVSRLTADQLTDDFVGWHCPGLPRY